MMMTMLILSIVGFAVIVWAVIAVMRRWNSRLGAILLGSVAPPIPVIIVAFVEAQFISPADWRAGGGFALQMTALYLAVFLTILGVIVSTIIAFTMKEPEDPGGPP